MPDQPWTIADAEDAYAEADLERTLEICELLLERNPDDADALYLMGEAMLELEEYEAAEEIFRDALGLEPEAGGLYNGLGVALFEQCRFDGARKALETALELDPRIAEARMYLGFFHERRGEAEQAEEQYRQAEGLDPEHFQMPAPLTIEQVQQSVELVIDRMPEQLRSYFSGIPWGIEDLPSTATLTRQQPPMSPLLTCLFEGEVRDPTRVVSPLDHAPAEIVLYCRNFEKTIRGPEDLPAALLNAMLVEMEHFLALDEAEVEALGLAELARQPALSPEMATLEQSVPPNGYLH